MFWFIAFIFVGSLVVAFSMMPKPQNAKPAGLGDIQAPTAEVGREISVLFGTRDFKGPNVVWYGHLKVVAIKSKGGKK